MELINFMVIGTICLSFFLFHTVNKIINYFGPPKLLIEANSNEKHKMSKSKRFWKYKNVFGSLLHSLSSGTLALLCFYQNEDIRSDLINTYTTGCVMLVSFSLGYFIHDAFDMIGNSSEQQSYELVIHHSIILVCFGISVFTRLFIGYALVALLVEVNSVFLHIRQLLGLLGFNKSDYKFRINNILNIGSFLVFRMLTLAWMTRWLVMNRNNVSFGYYTIGSVGMAIITLMNIVLFYRIIYSDFIKSKSRNTDNKDNYNSSRLEF